MRVGLFDSGIGGLTVLKTLLNKYPNNEYIYYGDTLNLPYGNKDINTLKKISENSVNFLLNKKVDIIIIACGTVSSNCVSYLKNKYKIPIYDIINPTINYLNNSKYQNIGIIATTRTINSHIFKNNINKSIYEIETPKLVPLIEDNNLDNLPVVLDEYLEEYINKLDILVLGCTHYPVIKDRISVYLNNKIELLDMSYLLELPSRNSNPKLEIYFTKLNNTIISNTKRILDKDNIDIKEI